MNKTEARAVFNKVIAGESNPDQVAKLELLREYFCNPEFKQALEDETWRRNATVYDESGFGAGAGVADLPDEAYDPNDFRDLGGMGTEPR